MVCSLHLNVFLKLTTYHHYLSSGNVSTLYNMSSKQTSLMSMDSQQNLYFAYNSYPTQIYSFNTKNSEILYSYEERFENKIINKNYLSISGSLITELTTSLGKADGNGNQASFNNSQGIYFDSFSKNLIIADYMNYAVRKMNQSGSKLLIWRIIFANKIII